MTQDESPDPRRSASVLIRRWGTQIPSASISPALSRNAHGFATTYMKVFCEKSRRMKCLEDKPTAPTSNTFVLARERGP